MKQLTKGRKAMNYSIGKKHMYFLIFENKFKIGVTNKLRDRMRKLGNEIPSKLNIEDSFYYTLDTHSSKSIELGIKRKYKNHAHKEATYVTETFDISLLEEIKGIVEGYHELFDYRVEKRFLTDEITCNYDKDGKFVTGIKKEKRD